MTTGKRQIGRKVSAPPATTPRGQLEAHVSRVEALEQENRELQAKLAEQERAAKDQKHADDVECIALLNAKDAGLDRDQAEALCYQVESARRAFVQNQKNAGLQFDAYGLIREKLAQLSGVLPPAKPSDPLAVHLPDPPQEGKQRPPGVAPGDTETAERAEQARLAQERGKKLAEEVRRDREAYRDALRRHGLADPMLGAPGSGRGFGQ